MGYLTDEACTVRRRPRQSDSVLQLCYADRHADLTGFVGVPHFLFSFWGGRALVQVARLFPRAPGVPVWRSSFLFVRVPSVRQTRPLFFIPFLCKPTNQPTVPSNPYQAKFSTSKSLLPSSASLPFLIFSPSHLQTATDKFVRCSKHSFRFPFLLFLSASRSFPVCLQVATGSTLPTSQDPGK